MNTNSFKGKWDEFKGEVRKTWGNITGDELEKTKGDMTAIKGLIQQKYQNAKEDVSQKLGAIADRYAESQKESLRKDNQEMDTRH